MRAIVYTKRPAVGQLEQSLEERVVPDPEPRRAEVRVRVQASTINIDDLHFAEGTMFGGLPVSPSVGPNKPAIPGTDLAGVIDQVGVGVKHLEAGQRVYGITNPMKGRGPWAELCCVPATKVRAMPCDWSFEDAAALALSGAVVVDAIAAASIVKGARCLVIGASGGIGSLCVQALANMGAEVWGVCSAKNADRVRELGATRVLDYTAGPIDGQVEPSETGLDAAFDFVGGQASEVQGTALLRPEGCFVTVVGPERFVGETDLGALRASWMFARIGARMLRSRLSRTRPAYCFAGPTTPNFDQIEQWIVAPGIRPLIDRVLPLAVGPLSEGIAYVRSHRAVGKVVLRVDPSG